MPLHHRPPRALAFPAVAMVIASAVSDVCAIPAFPGAEGFGANATGGRGGDVYHVTTLADDPNHTIPGSLFYGLYEKNVPPAGRTIVFDVGGTINLGATTLDIKNIKNVTIAGQTAPSPITIINNTVQITSSSGKETGNIILQYLTFRKGSGNGDDAFHIQGNGNTHDIIIDHVSGSWSEDEVISATQNANKVTVQNSIMSEALTSSHAYGSLIRPQNNADISFLRNLYSNQKSRNPRPGSYDGATLNFEFQNNVIYNWSDRAGYINGADGDTQHLNMNYVGNYLVAGPSTSSSGAPFRRTTAFIEELSSGAGNLLDVHVFQQNNKIDTNTNTVRDGTDTGWDMFRTLQTNGTFSAFNPSAQNTSPFAYPAYPYADSADVAYAKVISSAGAFPYARSATDQRLINDVLNYTGFAPITAPPTAEWTAITTATMTTRPAGWDTDNDGMPNWWESLRGFNPSGADNNTRIAPDSYTRLEKYLHYLSAQATWNLNADGAWSDYLNWRGTRPTSQDASANFPAGITAPRTVTIDLPVTLDAISLAGPQAYTLAGPGTLTLSPFAGRAFVSVPSGDHAISAPVALGSPTDFDLAGTLTLTNLQPAAQTLTKLGGGTLVVNTLNLPLAINAGTVRLAPDSPSTTATALSINTGATLDLTNNTATLPAAAATVREHLLNGRITSSTPDPSDLYSLAYLSTSPTATLVKFTFTGDANLDGVLTQDDFALIDRGLAMGGSVWSQGDFNYDGSVNHLDYLLIDRTYGQSQGLSPEFLSQRESQFGAAYVSELLTSVPEPSFALSSFLSLVLARRRR